MKTIMMLAMFLNELIIFPGLAKELSQAQNQILARSVVENTSRYVARLIECTDMSGETEITAAVDVLKKNVGLSPSEAIDSIISYMHSEVYQIGDIKGTESCSASQIKVWKDIYEFS